MHYVEEGSGQPIICLHGEPTWGYLYRRFIPPLSQSHRVIVPDHMGFGKSGTPRDRPYTSKCDKAPPSIQVRLRRRIALRPKRAVPRSKSEAGSGTAAEANRMSSIPQMSRVPSGIAPV
jgi:pimeloyl-ACP methyl ester carboxylesterase